MSFAFKANNSKSIIQLRDKEVGKYVNKPVMDVTIGLTKLLMNYTLIIRIYDNKIILNFEMGEMATFYGGYPPESGFDEIKRKFISIKECFLNKIENYVSS